jgi:anti-anti-sigma factor
MSVTVTSYGIVTVLTPRDDLLGDEVPTFIHRADQCVADEHFHVVVDCTSVCGLDSAGLEALLDLNEKCEAQLGSVKLCCVDANCAKILEITRLARRFEAFDDLESAVKSFT